MNFASDNWAGAAPEIAKALSDHAEGFAAAYGDSELDRRVEGLFTDLFEKECEVFFVGTGTAANSMAAAAVSKPGGVIFCHSEAHMLANEGGAPEFCAGGGRVVAVEGNDGKIDARALERMIAKYPNDFNHLGQGTMVSLTQSTEAGTVYSTSEIKSVCDVAHSASLPTHMDGARFANALVALECSPAEMTWKQGIDMISFGGTKNGCWCAEALIIFDKKLCGSFKFMRKRMGHLFSKTRFISAQIEAYLENDLWLDLARHSNAVGAALEDVVRNTKTLRLAWPSQSNQIFFIAERLAARSLLDNGAQFYPFATPRALEGQLSDDEQVYRLVTSFASTMEEVEAFANLLK